MKMVMLMMNRLFYDDENLHHFKMVNQFRVGFDYYDENDYCA